MMIKIIEDVHKIETLCDELEIGSVSSSRILISAGKNLIVHEPYESERFYCSIGGRTLSISLSFVSEIIDDARIGLLRCCRCNQRTYFTSNMGISGEYDCTHCGRKKCVIFMIPESLNIVNGFDFQMSGVIKRSFNNYNPSEIAVKI